MGSLVGIREDALQRLKIFLFMNSNMKILKNKPIVISFLQEKGGSGKTTMSVNVAHGLDLMGYKVLLVDGDPQGSARDWNAQNGGLLVPVIGLDRETLPIDLKAVKGGYDFVIIDGAPQISKLSAAAIRASDIVLIPVQPSPYDVWASADLVELIKARQQVTQGTPKVAFVVSRVIKNTKLSKEISDVLAEYEIPVFDSFTSQSVAYPTAASTGGTVWSHKNNSQVSEIGEIINELLRRFVGAED